VLEVQSDGTLKSLAASSETRLGGKAIYRRFNAFLLKMFGSDVLGAFLKNCEKNRQDMYLLFESKMNSVRIDDDTIHMKLPTPLYEIFEEKRNVKFEVFLSRSVLGTKVQKRQDMLIIDRSIFHEMFDMAARDINSYVDLEQRGLKQWCVKNIIMIGVFSDSAFMQKAVRDIFYGYEFIFPKGSDLAVVKGSVQLLTDTLKVWSSYKK